MGLVKEVPPLWLFTVPPLDEKGNWYHVTPPPSSWKNTSFPWTKGFTTPPPPSTRKIRNKKVKMMNGNINKTIKVVHWNLGSRYWNNKLEDIQHLVDEMNPDLAYISEANLFAGLALHLRQIEGYHLVYTKAMDFFGYSCLILLVKQGFQVKIMEDWMEEEVASIWTKIARRGCKGVYIGGIYREHKLLLQGYPNNTDDDDLQARRWSKFIQQWITAARGSQCFVIGDTNLDTFKWDSPDQTHLPMVQQTKDKIQSLNFTQIVEGATRSWPDKADSQIDHVWTNSPEMVLSSRNLVRATGDHNLLVIEIKIKGTEPERIEIKKRNWKQLNLERFRETAAAINWEDMYSLTNLDQANSMFVDKITNVLDIEAPWKIFLPRFFFRNWISSETKVKMKCRDETRERARISKSTTEWNSYKQLRNECNSRIKKDRLKILKTNVQ